MAEVNWLEWMVLRCEAKLIQMEIKEGESRRSDGGGEGGKTLDWRGGNFPREGHKTD